MASFFSSSNSPSEYAAVTDEEFYLFHSIDRTLFSRLLFNLHRSPGQSTQVMSLWMWLEHNGEEFNLVHKMLPFSDNVIDSIADESVLALTCIETDHFPFGPEIASLGIPLMQKLTKSGVTLRYFHENRLSILRGVTILCNEVCMRAFKDVIHDYQERLTNPNYNMSRPVVNNYNKRRPASGNDVGFVSLMAGSSDEDRYPPFSARNQRGSSVTYIGDQQNIAGGFMPFGYEPSGSVAPHHDHDQRQQTIINNEMSELISGLQLNFVDDNDNDHQFIPIDERTLFLTFSKGYPISRDEIWEHFTRKFGNRVEAVSMQEVPDNEQPLFANLVVKSQSSMDEILEGKTKTKFSINGKHLWARKYVRRDAINRPPPRASPPASSQPPLPQPLAPPTAVRRF